MSKAKFKVQHYLNFALLSKRQTTPSAARPPLQVMKGNKKSPSLAKGCHEVTG